MRELRLSVHGLISEYWLNFWYDLYDLCNLGKNSSTIFFTAVDLFEYEFSRKAAFLS